jgi:hypothetical protein
VVLYSVPADRTAIFRLLTFYNNAAATPDDVALAINGSTGTAYIRRFSLGAGASLSVSDYIVLNPGDTLRVVNTGGNNLRCAGFGSLLLGAPS